jgi:hypothetical protein
VPRDDFPGWDDPRGLVSATPPPAGRRNRTKVLFFCSLGAFLVAAVSAGGPAGDGPLVALLTDLGILGMAVAGVIAVAKLVRRDRGTQE